LRYYSQLLVIAKPSGDERPELKNAQHFINDNN
jgi:hypothetical protein